MPLHEFKSQESLKKYFRNIINTIGQCNSVKTLHNIEFEDFCEVFKRHSDYPAKFIGLDDIKIDYNPVFKKELVVYIIKKDGTIDDVSVLNNCITGKPKDNFKIAMRVSIQPQIEEYKNNNCNIFCEICNSYERLEVDHHSELSPFAKLYRDFMHTNMLPIPETFDNTESHMKCFNKVDHEFEKSWIQYHKENAILRTLCSTCNNSQPKYKN